MYCLGTIPRIDAVVDHDSTIEQTVAGGNRRPDDDELRAARSRLGDPQDGPNAGVQQRRLAEQIAAGIARDAQFRDRARCRCRAVGRGCERSRRRWRPGWRPLIRGETQVMRTNPYWFM